MPEHVSRLTYTLDDPFTMASFSWFVMEGPEGNEFCLVQPGELSS